jgi:hypothetical protein
LRRPENAVTTTVKHAMMIVNRRLHIDKFLVATLTLAAWVGGSGHASVFAQNREASEYAIKAAFLYNFAKFTEWPPESAGKADDPITLCVVGEDPFGNILNQTIEGKTVRGRRMVIWRLRPGEDLKGCQIAFIGSPERSQMQAILERLKGAGVLTVGDSEGFAALGGMINFTKVDNKVHFNVNVNAAERARLKISSKLLSLAKIVKDEGKGTKN